jgi:hypothetical protein
MGIKQQDIRSRLTLIQGGVQCEMAFGPVRIVAAPENRPPFDVEAVAYEEDTWLIMSADPKICQPEEHPIRLMTDLIEAQPETVGSVRVQGANPLRFLAVVHDVNQEPTWKAEWIEKAFANIFRESERRKLTAVAVPMLGSRHGRLDPKDVTTLLGRSLKQQSFVHLKRLWLIASSEAGASRGIVASLRAILDAEGGSY